MFLMQIPSAENKVALLAEGVDRNRTIGALVTGRNVSPSSRRAWIEIPCQYKNSLFLNVALLAEGVDRNNLLVYSV